MSEILIHVVERAGREAAFCAWLQSNPEAALAGYDLTVEERVALGLRYGTKLN
jgi:hypothetical protein